MKHLKISVKKTVILPYFVESYQKTNPLKRSAYFLFVGRLSEEKGIIELLEVFKTLPEAKLKVIGTGPLEKKVNQYKKYKNIDVLGYLPHYKISGYIRKAKAMIIASLWYEVLPLVYLEALVNNTPVFYRLNSPVFSKRHLFAFLKKNKFLYEHKDLELYSKDYHYQKLIKVYSKVILP